MAVKKRLGRQLIIAVGLVSASILTVFSFFVVRAERRAIITHIETDADQLSETIKSATRHAMLVNHRDNVHQIIDTIGRQEGIDNVRVFNKEGIIIYSPDKTLEGTMVDKRAEACFICHAVDSPLERLAREDRTRIFEGPDGHRYLGVVNPIYNEASCSESDCHAHPSDFSVLGVLDVTMSLAEVDREIAHNTRRALGSVVAVILAVSAIIWFFFHFLVGRPVNQLLAATEHVARGDLDYKIPVHRNDEMGHLGYSFNEMTDRLAEAQTQIYQSSKLASIGRLAAGVAHEINNPLTGILTHGSFALKQARGHEVEEDLDVIVREAKRCREIVHGLLDFSRQTPARKLSVDCNEVIRRSIDIVANELSVGNITVEKILQEDLPPVTADPNQLTQVLINLLVNAADAMPESGGNITLTTAVKVVEGVRRVEIKVTDTGEGIPAKDLKQIFEPFFTTKGRNGTGLGLAVVWGIISEHGGEIRVDSVQGQGATFMIHLPVRPEWAMASGDE